MLIEGIIVNGTHFLFSRTRHDFRTYEGHSIDGGQFDYSRVSWPQGEPPKFVWAILHNVTYADLYNDWNLRQNKFGIHKLSEVEIIDEQDPRKPELLADLKDQEHIWGTKGIDGDQPTTYKLIRDLDTDHLINILNNCPHIRKETRNYIELQLEKRK